MRRIRKFARYSNQPETEVELLLYFCLKMQDIKPSIFKNKTLTNIYNRQIESAQKKRKNFMKIYNMSTTFILKI